MSREWIEAKHIVHCLFKHKVNVVPGRLKQLSVWQVPEWYYILESLR